MKLVPGINLPPALMQSTVERELLFASSHAIHHVALVLRIAEKYGAHLPGELGVAFSTATYRAVASG